MANQSFDEMMVIDTPEKMDAFIRMYEEAEKRGPLVLDRDRPSIFDLLKESKEYLERHSLDDEWGIQSERDDE